MDAMLRVAGLRKQFGDVVALGGVDLEVQRGEVFGFLGPNGAGKTTFTKCVTGFVRPNAGTVHVAGIDARAQPSLARSHIGLVPDQYDFYPNLTGRQHLDFYGRLAGMRKEMRDERVAQVLGFVRMEENADRRTRGYSHGMKQRICIAQAILHEPDLIFFDEPTNGLDPKGAYELRQLIRSLADAGHTVFLNSHLLSEVEEICDRVAVLQKGTILAMDTVDAIRQRAQGKAPAHLRVANPTKRIREALERVVGSLNMEGNQVYSFPADDAAMAAAVAAAVGAGAKILEARPGKATLESAFLELTEEVA